MKARVLPIVLLFILASLPYEVAADADRARITQMVGKVEVRSKAQAKWRTARIGMMVKAHWDIRSFLESEAEVTFDNGTKVKVGENSVVTLSRLMQDADGKSSKTTVKVMTGKVWANVKKITETNSEFDFETPTAVASIRGTRLGIDVVKNRTFVDVYEGTVAVRKVNGKQAVKVSSSMRAVVEKEKEVIALVSFKKVREESGAKNAAVELRDPYADKDSGTDSLNVQKNDSAAINTVPEDTSATPITDTVGMMDEADSDNDPVLNIVSPELTTVVEESPLMVKGSCTPGARVTINGIPVESASDGTFSGMVEVKPGGNSITVTAVKGDRRKTVAISCEYRIPLRLEVNNLEDGMTVTSKTIQLSVAVSEGADYSVNGMKGVREVPLNEGANSIVIEAWDQWNNRKREEYTVYFKSTENFILNVISPSEGVTITQPFIQVTGSTKPDAKVFVNEMQAAVGRDGFFSVRLPIPDEPYAYSVEIVAQYEGNELSAMRSVTYASPKKKLFLECTTPVDGQQITARTIHVSGRTTPLAYVSANGIPVAVAPNGVFSGDVSISEKDIGEYQLEITARDDEDEISRVFMLTVSGKSPVVNTSVPVCIVSQQGIQATMQRTLTVQFLDRTPEEELTMTVKNNGVADVVTTEPGRTETILLNEGKNDYSIQVTDMAGNTSPVIRGKVYYLPGPVILNLNEPPSNPMVYEGVPPVLHPGYAASEEPVDVEVEIDDGIGTVPESIRYCRVTGNGETILLRNNNDYIFVGKVNVRRGKNQFIVQAEDLSGRLETLRFVIIVE